MQKSLWGIYENIPKGKEKIFIILICCSRCLCDIKDKIFRSSIGNNLDINIAQEHLVFLEVAIGSRPHLQQVMYHPLIPSMHRDISGPCPSRDMLHPHFVPAHDQFPTENPVGLPAVGVGG
jgi:hypothetical protein